MLEALVLLLVTSLSCVGLLATWAATSSQHWFWRACLFVAVLSLLLLIPAFEPFVVFSLLGGFVAAGIRLARWRQNKNQNENNTTLIPQFSLASILLLTVFVAIAATVLIKLPEQNFYSWLNILLLSLISGTSVLLALWIVYGRLVRWWLRVAVGLVFAPILSLPLVFSDWIILTITTGALEWPPDADPTILFGLYDEYHPGELFGAWASIVIAIVFILALLFWLITIVAALSNHNRTHLIACSVLVLLILLLAITPLTVYYKLLTPLPIPKVLIPDPNGWNDLVAIGKQAENSSHYRTISNYDTATEAQLATAVDAMAPIYQQITDGLNKQVVCPVEYDESWFDTDVMSSFRTLARIISGRSVFYRNEERFDDAANSAVQGIKLGYASRRGGLIIESLTGNACSGIGRSNLYEVRTKLTAEHCLELAAILRKIDANIEPLEELLLRDRIWNQYGYGWPGHLLQMLDDFSGEGRFDFSDAITTSFQREQASMRLLQLELALQAWQRTNQSPPTSLDILIPDYLPEIPVDPFSSDGSLLQYHRTQEGYLLYSVGRDGIDNGGEPHLKEDYIFDYDHGDFRLDIHYAPNTTPTNEDKLKDENEISTEPAERIGNE